MTPAFRALHRIDHSGAQTVTSNLIGLRLQMADRASPQSEVLLRTSPRKYWARQWNKTHSVCSSSALATGSSQRRI